VLGEETYWLVKQAAVLRAALPEAPTYEDIEMPRNSSTGFVCAFFATLMGFALIWHIWWLFGAGFAGAYVTFVVFAWRDVEEQIIPAGAVAQIDGANREARAWALASYAAP